MREIKFRAWFKNEREMKDVAINNIYKGNNTFLYLSPLPMSDYKPVDLMQYTGLKDKNGVEIYEGDGYFIGTEFRYVGFEDGIFFSYKKNGTQQESLYYCLSLGVEIIGNIYENPELLIGHKS